MKTTKERILEVALDLYLLGGFNSVSVDEICKEAKVLKGSFYHHFKSKSALICEIFDIMDAYYKDLILTEVKGHTTQEKIQSLVALIKKEQTEKQKQYGIIIGCPFVTSATELCCNYKEIASKMQSITHTHQTLLAQVLNDKTQQVDAIKISAFISGIMFLARIQNSLEALDHLEEGLLKLVG